MKFFFIPVRLTLSPMTAKLGQKCCSVNSVRHYRTALRSVCVSVGGEYVRNAASRFIFYASSDRRKYVVYTNLANLFF